MTVDDNSSEQHAGDDPSDRRLATRVLVDLEVDYGCEDTFLFAYITDMSALGIFIRTNNPEPRGTSLQLRFTVPEVDASVEIEGRVAWTNPFRPGDFDNTHPGMGVEFVDPDEDTRARLMEIVRRIAYIDRATDSAAPVGPIDIKPTS